MRLFQYLSMVLAATAMWAVPVQAEPVELIFAHVGAPGSLLDLSVNEFAKRANAKLPETYRIVPAGSSKYGGDTAVLEKIKKGEVAFGLPSSVMSSLSEKFGIFELPFLIRNREQVRKISDALLDEHLQPELKPMGLRIIAIWENGFRQITNNVRPINKPEDMSGLKIRIPKGKWREKAFRALGAEPVPIAPKEIYGSLKSGKVDGQENPLAQINGFKWYEVQRYLTLSDHVYTPAYVVVNDKKFAELPPEVQKTIIDVAKDVRTWTFHTAVRLESELVDQLGETMKVNQLDVKAFRAVSRPLYGEFVRTVPGGAQLVTTVAELAEIATSELGTGEGQETSPR
jgi:tripartite ATP-independent transporter DctP family solute receptor